MNTENRFKMSAERLAELKSELERMTTVERTRVADLIREARSFGDLSENSEYDEARNEQGKLESRIKEIENLIANAVIVDMTASADKVGHGSHVKVRDLTDGSVEEYSLVGSQEADPMEGLVSSDSPFGQGLMGHAVGEIVTVEAPAGQFQYEIIEIEN